MWAPESSTQSPSPHLASQATQFPRELSPLEGILEILWVTLLRMLFTGTARGHTSSGETSDVPYTLTLMTEGLNEKSAYPVADPGGRAEFGGAKEDISRINKIL